MKEFAEQIYSAGC